MLRIHGRGDLAHDQLGHRRQVALTLEHARDPGQVGLQPILLGVALGRLAQVGDHLVDVVLELGDLALGLDRDRSRQVALGDRGGDLGDRPDLRGQVPGQLIDVLGQPAPRAGDALDLGLATELALGADLARDAGDLGRERGQLRDHAVDRLLELEDLAAGVDGDRLAQVAVGDRGGDLGDVAHLVGEVAGHEVDVVGQVLPRAGHTGHRRLAAERALGAHFSRHARHFRRERAQLVDHPVDRVLRARALVHRGRRSETFLAEVAARRRRRSRAASRSSGGRGRRSGC